MEIIAVLGYVDPCLGAPYRARRPFPAERRPKFISVALWGALFPGAFNLSIRFKLCVRTAIIRYAPCAVGLMEIENIIRYTELAVGLMEIENL